MTATKQRQKVTRIPREYKKGVRDGLRRSRDLMNDDGDHWTKGEYKRTHPMQDGQFQWCAVGGIREMLQQAVVERYAIIALAERGIDMGYVGARYDSRLDDEQSNWDWDEVHYPNEPHEARPEKLTLDQKAAICEDLVTEWNDQVKRTWSEVRDAFTRAAAAIR